MIKIFTLIISICVMLNLNAQTKIKISDFKVLNNSNWKGTLTYKNYSDRKQVILKTTLSILVTKNKIITKIKFPNEPKANSKKIIKIKRKGTYFGNEKVIKKEFLENGIIKITTFYKGNDNNKKANINNIYVFNKDSFSITKEVTYLSSRETIIRNKQNYKRIKNK